jgi:hypothetical protein
MPYHRFSLVQQLQRLSTRLASGAANSEAASARIAGFGRSIPYHFVTSAGASPTRRLGAGRSNVCRVRRLALGCSPGSPDASPLVRRPPALSGRPPSRRPHGRAIGHGPQIRAAGYDADRVVVRAPDAGVLARTLFAPACPSSRNGRTGSPARLPSDDPANLVPRLCGHVTSIDTL